MIELRKANRVIDVTENELDKYLSKGYVIVNKESQPAEVSQVDAPTISEPEVPKQTYKRRKK